MKSGSKMSEVVTKALDFYTKRIVL